MLNEMFCGVSAVTTVSCLIWITHKIERLKKCLIRRSNEVDGKVRKVLECNEKLTKKLEELKILEKTCTVCKEKPFKGKIDNEVAERNFISGA